MANHPSSARYAGIGAGALVALYIVVEAPVSGTSMTITLPAYVTDVAKVQIYCAWAEAVLGEAPFDSPQMTH